MRKLNQIFIGIVAILLLASCSQDGESPMSGNTTGQAGSLARYAVAGPNFNYLYSVSRTELIVTDITNLESPVNVSRIPIADWWQVETIFPFTGYLLLGSEAGMMVYNIETDPQNPEYVSQFSHVRGCDPVVAQSGFAYVTLRGNGNCGAAEDELHVLDIESIEYPRLLYSIPMAGPYGLGIDGDLLFVCDGDAGLKVFDASNPAEGLDLITTFPDVNAKDVIPYNGILLMIGDDGFYQYTYSNKNIEFLSKIAVPNS